MNKQLVLDAHQRMCDAKIEYRNAITDYLKETGGVFELDNGYGEEGEPLEIDVVDDNGTGVDHSAVDMARYNAEKDYIEFHVTSWNYDDVDYWIAYYFLGSEDTYAMGNILL